MTIKELNLSEEQLEVVQKLIQSEGDRVRTEYSRKNKELAEELEKYKPTEKSPAEKALEERIKALESKETEIMAKEKSMQIADKLSAKGLPKELAKYLNMNEDMDAVIEEVGTVVNSYFLNNGNKPGNHSKQQGVTKEQFRAMSYGQRAKLFEESPELYKALSN